jgi:Tfp pilus assembly protein PilF
MTRGHGGIQPAEVSVHEKSGDIQTRERIMKKIAGIAMLGACALFIGINGWAQMGSAAPALQTAAGSKAESHNKEGIEHYNQGHWDVAKKHFTEAAKADPKSAEVHYNLALTLDKSGDHKAATEHFKTAFDLGKNNADIQNSGILKAHLKMK